MSEVNFVFGDNSIRSVDDKKEDLELFLFLFFRDPPWSRPLLTYTPKKWPIDIKEIIDDIMRQHPL